MTKDQKVALINQLDDLQKKVYALNDAISAMGLSLLSMPEERPASVRPGYRPEDVARFGAIRGLTPDFALRDNKLIVTYRNVGGDEGSSDPSST